MRTRLVQEGLLADASPRLEDMGEIRVGTAGWTDRSLIASGWYPADANNPEKRLRFYARQFPLVEVDATYVDATYYAHVNAQQLEARLGT